MSLGCISLRYLLNQLYTVVIIVKFKMVYVLEVTP